MSVKVSEMDFRVDSDSEKPADSLSRLSNFFGGKMDPEFKSALKEQIAKNSLDHKDDVMPLEYEQRSCADILSAAMLSPTSDDAKKFWNKDTHQNYVVESGYQYTIG